MLDVVLMGLFGLIFFSYLPRTDYYFPKWWLLTQVAITILCYQMYLQGSWTMSVFFYYLASSSSFYGINKIHNHFTNKKYINGNAHVNEGNALSSIKALVAIISLSIVFNFLDEKMINDFITVCPILTIIGAIWMVLPLKWITVKHKGKSIAMYGFGGNPSVSASFQSMLAAITLINPIDPIIISAVVLSCIAIIRTKASSGLGAIIAAIGIYILINHFYIGLSLLLISPLVIYLINKIYDNKLFCLSGRDELVKFSFKNLYARNSKLFGNGIGSFAFTLPALIIAKKKRNEKIPVNDNFIFLWMHCDPLQFLIEGGYIGCLLLLILLGDISINLYDQLNLLPFFIATLVNLLTNFPCHIGTDSTLIVTMLKYLYLKQK